MGRAKTGGTAEVGDAPLHTPWGVVDEIFRITLAGRSGGRRTEPLPDGVRAGTAPARVLHPLP
ncbi:hypothetical protein [Streptomyces sp. NPDC007369]|uniref:hypothetical protein n=1 Tax=Streptomyces sp. NPDC007369 TaxID=3154589 RepID=UPI0033F4FB14